MIRHSDLFFQTSDATWQAYNVYGGNGLYLKRHQFCEWSRREVSLQPARFLTRNGGGGVVLPWIGCSMEYRCCAFWSAMGMI